MGRSRERAAGKRSGWQRALVRGSVGGWLPVVPRAGCSAASGFCRNAGSGQRERICRNAGRWGCGDAAQETRNERVNEKRLQVQRMLAISA